ncbi:MFS transporter [Desulforamulus ruminis]|uniref:Major facilitator superfamily MFS_1 n=1 Tax=Desulforamulus ruminis (strain ATCC 23193 / DSM 2154 / NCIMB 8452 / DL) TaxID=696281 RepID=F6DKU1_DESRL|nr:MFS transporter [Desulforamulus ruminis]AEG61573.1 major facilitator superfamily MFS_1 [Desulforamulus ruminis DSM 2154]
MFNSLHLNLRDFGLIILLFLTELIRSALFLTFWPLYSVNFLGFSVVAAGVVVSTQYLSETLFKIAAGYHLDRYGRPVLVTGVLVSLAALIGLYHTETQWCMILLAAIFGLGFAPVWLAVISQIAPSGHPDRASRIGLVFMAWLLGAGIGPVGINFILPWGFANTFQMLILLWIMATLLVLFIPVPSKNHGGPRISLMKQLNQIASKEWFVKLLLPGMFLQTLAASLLLPILPLYATQILGLDSRQYGLLLTCGGAATVLFLIPMGKLIDRFSLKAVLTTGFTLSAIFLGTVPFTHNLTAVFALVILVGISYAIILPSWNSLLAEAIPAEHQATGWGLFSTLEGLGIATGPALGGFISGLIHPAGAIFFSAMILALMGLFYFFYPMDCLLNDRE